MMHVAEDDLQVGLCGMHEEDSFEEEQDSLGEGDSLDEEGSLDEWD